MIVFGDSLLQILFNPSPDWHLDGEDFFVRDLRFH